MLAAAIALVIVFALLVAGELLWRGRDIHPEYKRKFVHLTVGTFVAFWPLFLNMYVIVGLSLAFVATVALSSYFNIFKSIHSVQRPTWGEVFFALSVGFLAIVAHNQWIYAAALLHMSLADGLAAIVGTRFRKFCQYHVFGHRKSLAGTATFVVVSWAIFAGYFLLTPSPFTWWFVPISLAAALLENVAVRGLDNLLVPLLVALSLNLVG